MQSVLDRILELMSSLGPWAYVLIFFLAFFETAAFIGFIVPGETIVVFSGFLVSQQILNLNLCLFVTMLGAILGACTGYEVGKRLDRNFFEKRDHLLFIKKSHLEKAQRYFELHGGKTIFFGRFSGFLRAFTPVFAGMSRMRYRKFLLFNVSGGILWVLIFTVLGYYFGHNWKVIETYARTAGLYFFLAVALVALTVYAVKRRAMKAGS